MAALRGDGASGVRLREQRRLACLTDRQSASHRALSLAVTKLDAMNWLSNRKSRRRLEDDVAAGSAVEDVLSAVADQDVVSCPAGQRVIAGAADQDVVAVAAIGGELYAAGASPVALMTSSPPSPLMTSWSLAASKLVIVTSRVTPASSTMCTVTTPLSLLIVITSSPLVALMTTVSAAPSGAPFTPRSILTWLTSVPVRSLTVTVSGAAQGVDVERLRAVHVHDDSRRCRGSVLRASRWPRCRYSRRCWRR